LLVELESLIPLAPLHQPHSLAPIRTALALVPTLPQVACFDTAFHRSMPEVAQAFALTRELHDEGIRRYGFHGLSYEYIASVLPERAPEIADRRTPSRRIHNYVHNGQVACASLVTGFAYGMISNAALASSDLTRRRALLKNPRRVERTMQSKEFARRGRGS
jgi:acetate kinase